MGSLRKKSISFNIINIISGSLCNKVYVQFGETFYMLVTNVFCKESVSTAQVVANTSVESILFSL